MDFCFFAFEERAEARLWDIYLRTDMKKDFNTFKKQQLKSIRKATKKVKAPTDAEEKVLIERASRFIKPHEDKESKDGIKQ